MILSKIQLIIDTFKEVEVIMTLEQVIDVL